jgi:hypothetical protein
VRVALGALGLDPSNACYDPNRPSLLPYWINDSTETACLQAAEGSVSAYAGFTEPTVQAPTLTPTLSTVTSPGLPAGYDPTTGEIDPDNTTGATTTPTPGYAAAISQSAAAANTPAPWYCTYFDIGCGSGGSTSVAPSTTLMFVLGAIAVVGIGIAIFRR